MRRRTSRLLATLLAALALGGCTQQRPQAAVDGPPATVEGEFDLVVSEIDAPSFEYGGDPQNCVQLVVNSTTRVLGGNATVAWTANSPTANRLDFGVWTSRLDDLVRVSGTSPLAIEIPRFEVVPDDFAFVYVGSPKGVAWEQPVHLRVSVGSDLPLTLEKANCAFASPD